MKYSLTRRRKWSIVDEEETCGKQIDDRAVFIRQVYEQQASGIQESGVQAYGLQATVKKTVQITSS